MKLLLVLLIFATSPALAAEIGVASWYGKDHHGRLTATGERFDMYAATCAHKIHYFGTILKVTARNGKSTVCRVNDRGPFIRGRIIDLSLAGATELGIVRSGTAWVTVVPTGDYDAGDTIMPCRISAHSLAKC